MTSVTNLSANAASFLSAFDGAIDEFCTNGTKFNVEALIDRSKLRSADLISIQTKLQKTTDELELLVIDADEQITEGYSNLTKAQQREMLTMYHAIMEKVPANGRKPRAVQPKDGVIRVKSVVAKPAVVTETCNAVFTGSNKYKVTRVFIGDVKIAGNKVSANEVYQIRMPKDTDMEAMKTLTTIEEVKTFITGGKQTCNTPTTLSGDTIDFVLKF